MTYTIDWTAAMRDTQQRAAVANARNSMPAPGVQTWPKPVQQWTRERPTVPGWYWCRTGTRVRLIHLRAVAGGWWAQEATRESSTNADMYEGEWSGPLEPPP